MYENEKNNDYFQMVIENLPELPSSNYDKIYSYAGN